MNKWIKNGGVHEKPAKSTLKRSASTLKRPAAAGDNTDVGDDDADVGNVDPGKSKKFKKTPGAVTTCMHCTRVYIPRELNNFAHDLESNHTFLERIQAHCTRQTGNFPIGL